MTVNDGDHYNNAEPKENQVSLIAKQPKASDTLTPPPDSKKSLAYFITPTFKIPTVILLVYGEFR